MDVLTDFFFHNLHTDNSRTMESLTTIWIFISAKTFVTIGTEKKPFGGATFSCTWQQAIMTQSARKRNRTLGKMNLSILSK